MVRKRPRIFAALALAACAGFIAGLANCQPAIAQERLTLKSGMTYQTGERSEEIWGALPNFSASPAGDVATKPILLIPDGLRRVFVPKHSAAGGFVNAPNPGVERFTIPQITPTGGSILGNAGPIIKRGPFDAYGRRVMVMASAEGNVLLHQGVTEINPRYIKVEGLAGGGEIKALVSDMRFRTNSIPADELRAMIYKQINMDDARERLRVYRLFFQAQRYGDAADELERIIKQFPDLAELKEQEKSLLQIGAQEFIREIDRRAEAGQHNLAITRLQNFPREGIAGETLIRVRDKLKNYEDMLKQRDGVITALERDLPELADPAAQKSVAEVIEEIKETIKVSTLPRLADYDRLKDDKSLPVDQRFALAVGGWVLGQGFTKARTLSVALSAYEVRKLTLRYMRTSVPAERAAILKLINEQEAGSAEFLSRIVINMEPFVETPPPTEGAPPGFYELTCRGASPTSPPVPYLVQLPPEYDPRRFYPTIVALNGQNAPPRGQIDWWAGPPLPDGTRPGQATRHGYIVIAPLWSTTGAVNYLFSAEEHAAVINSLRDACRRFSVDTDRVFLTGLAAGADAAWDIGLSHPDLWAGVIPIGPRINTKAETDRYLGRYGENAKGLPLYILFGEKDGNPLTARFGELVDKYFRDKDCDCTLIEYQGRGLEDYFEDVIEVFRWMELYRRDFKRKKFDKFASMRPWDNFAWCLELDEFEPRWIVLPLAWPPPKGFRMATSSYNIVDSDRGTTVINVDSSASKLTLWLSPDFINMEKPLRVRWTGAEPVEVKPSAETLLEDVRTRGDRQHPFWMKASFSRRT